MGTWIAQHLTQKLIVSGVVEESERDLYTYGFFLLISRVFFLLVTALVGFLLGIPGASVLFYVLFTLLRGYAGGVHAKTENACTILTVLAMVTSLIGMKLMEVTYVQIIPMGMLVVGSIAVFLLCPLDTAEKPLEISERKRYRAISIVILLSYLLLVLAAWVLAWRKVIYAVACSVFLEGILLIAGKVSSVYWLNC